MKVSDFAAFFGTKVLLQFRDTLVLAEAGQGPGKDVPVRDSAGRPLDAEGKPIHPDAARGKTAEELQVLGQTTWPIAAARDTDGKYLFSYFVESAEIFPVGERLNISYERDGATIELLVDPEFILACQKVRYKEAPPEPPLITRA